MGALDGKYVAISQPDNSGSEYFNYKGFFSIVLLALVDADYRFLYVDVGSSGREGDAGIFDKSDLKNIMDNKTAGFPKAEILQGTSQPCEYHIIGDDAFPLRKDLMKPFPHRNLEQTQQIFNYRISCARRVVENAFGILAHRFRVLLTRLNLNPCKATTVVLAVCVLHNCLIDNQRGYAPATDLDYEDDKYGLILGAWRKTKSLENMQATRIKHTPLCAKNQRSMLQLYFNSNAGAVPWQARTLQCQKI